MIDDGELLRRYGEDGSQEAFAEIVTRHIDVVYAAALRQLGDAHQARDVTQSVFIDLARKVNSVSRHPVLLSWLYTSVRYAAAKTRRAEQRRRHREEEALVMQEQTSSDSNSADWERIRPALDDAMNDLAETDRQAILLRFFSSAPFSVVGARLRLSEQAAQKRVERALDKLRLSLTQRGITSTSAALSLVLAHEAVVAAPAGLAAQTASIACAGVAAATGAATAGTSTSFNFLSLMTTSKIAAIAGVLCLLTAGSAIFQRNQWLHARASLESALRERNAATAQIADLEKRARELEAAANAERERSLELEHRLRESSASAKTALLGPASPSSSTKQIPTPTQSRLSSYDFYVSDVTWQNSYLKAFAAGLRLTYGSLYETFHLTSDQITEFENAMIEYQRSVFDTGTAARDQGIAVTDNRLKTITNDALTTLKEKLANVLGTDGWKVFGDFWAGNDARSTVNTLVGYLHSTAAPLTPFQEEKMIQVLTANASRTQLTGLVGNGWKPNVEAIVSQSKMILSPPQAAVFEAMIRSNQLYKDANERSMQLTNEAIQSLLGGNNSSGAGGNSNTKSQKSSGG